MTGIGVLEIAVFFAVLILVTKPLGLFMARVFQGQRTFLHPVMRPLERLVYKLCGIREEVEQRWTHYAGGVLASAFSPSSSSTSCSGCKAICLQPAGLWREVDLAGSGLQHRHQLPH